MLESPTPADPIGPERHSWFHGSRRTEGPTSVDLFSAAAKKADPIVTVASETQVSPDPSSSPPRYLLPKDLSGALARLDVGEIDSLLTALIDEARRRGRRQTKESTMANEKDFRKISMTGGHRPEARHRTGLGLPDH